MTLQTNEIAQLLLPFLDEATLSAAQLDSLQRYLDLLLKWNSKMNLTAIRDPKEIVTRHFGESLFAARTIFPKPKPESVIDVGSGAGFPGIPIKIWNAAAQLTLIESSEKKATFLRELARTLDLNGVSVQATRAETVAARANVVTLRAVERFEQILPTARRLVQPSGRLALLIGTAQIETARTVLPNIHWKQPLSVPLSQSRVLLLGNT
jgi:16S rRNA (guanine527-N7)-methyltransferase